MKKTNALLFLSILILLTVVLAACGSSGGDTPPPGNRAPVADAGPDQNASTLSVVTLDGSGSSDPDAGDTLTYAWTINNVPGASGGISLSNAAAVDPTFTPDVDGDYVFSLIVNDGAADSTPDVVTITAAGNFAPLADAGPNQYVLTNSVVNLDGSGSSDFEDDTLSYSWTLTNVPSTSTATLLNATTVSPVFTADLDGTYTVELIVNDGAADSAADVATIIASSTPVAADTLILNIDSAGDTTYTETADAGSPTGLDPTIHGYYETGNAVIAIHLFSGYGAGVWDEQFSLEIPGNTLRTYTLGENAAAIYVPVNPLNTYGPDNGDYTSISITLTQYDAVGGRIKGTFNSTLCYLLSFDCSVPSNRKTFVGSFDVTRDPDL